MKKALSDNESQARKKAYDLLAQRPHSRAELIRKLSGRFTAEVITAVIEECERCRFIDDRQFAEAYTEELLGNGYGRFRIQDKLYRKGIDKNIIAAVIQQLPEQSERGAALDALKKKMRLLSRESNPRKRYEKAYRHLAGKGFSGALINSLLQTDDFENS
jgi:regulatory protein